MSKILISFIGTGIKDKNDREGRDYVPATYKLGEQTKKTKFVSKALSDFLQPNKMFLIGTPHSMWEEVYKTFSEESGSFNIDTYVEIGDWCERADSETPADGLPHKSEIEKAIGEDSKAFIIRYGINDEQIIENIDVILGLSRYIENNDEVIFDITHCFRSIPLLIMQLILYLKQVSAKHVNISHVYYGMLDIRREIMQTTGEDYAPIIDLSRIIELNDWITGAYTFNLTGVSSKVCSLMEAKNKSASKCLNKFSQLLSLNDPTHLQEQAAELKGIKYDSAIEAMAIQPVVAAFTKAFGKDQKASKLQYELAKWQYSKMNYFASYTTLVESIVTKVCEDSKLDWNVKENREMVRSELKAKGSDAPRCLRYAAELIETYRTVNPIRNTLVHQNGYDRNSASKKVKILREAIAALQGVMAESPET